MVESAELTPSGGNDQSPSPSPRYVQGQLAQPPQKAISPPINSAETQSSSDSSPSPLSAPPSSSSPS